MTGLPEHERLDLGRVTQQRKEYQREYRKERRSNGRDRYPDERGYRYRPYDARNSAFHQANIVAWDGEAVTENGEHRYVLLSNSLGDRLVNLRGIGTSQALHFMTNIGQKLGKKTIHVSYGFSYDVNMILKDLPQEKLRDLWVKGETEYDYIYRIHYVWRRELRIHRLGEPRWVFSPKYNKPIPNVEAAITVWDTLGFSQSSFVSAIKKWLPDLSPEDVAYIESMKAGRSSFTSEQMDDIIRYNDLENEYLVRIHKQIIDSHKTAGLTLSRHDGAGSSATAALKKFRVKGYMAEEPHDVYMAARYAYFGGRIEAIKIGNAERQKVYRYDINSAYPSVIAKLPCLNHGRWTHRTFRKTPKELDPFAVYRLRFEDGHVHRPFYPLPYREAHGTILFPDECEGWYWTPEAELALESQDASCLKFFEAWVYERDCKCEPFAWVPQLYDLRQEYKKQGSNAEKVIKLGMNALYGKFAQQIGGRNGRIPSYHQLSWAGYVTSATRASMYRLANRRPEVIVAFATDGIFATERLRTELGTGLGSWSEDVFDGMTIVQPGVYWLRTGDTWESKYRGFDTDSLDRSAIVDAWRNGGTYSGTVTRFVGLGSALAGTSRWDQWRTWVTEPRRLDIYPMGKRRTTAIQSDYHKRLVPTGSMVNLTPEDISEPHGIRWINGDPQRDLIDGIDIHVYERELEDSWV